MEKNYCGPGNTVNRAGNFFRGVFFHFFWEGGFLWSYIRTSNAADAVDNAISKLFADCVVSSSICIRRISKTTRRGRIEGLEDWTDNCWRHPLYR